MIKKIKNLLDTLQQELIDGYNTNDMGYIDMAQNTLYELQKQITELEQGLEQGKNFSLLGEDNG
jgi:cob(I)alamin adenosyltransferase